MLTYQKVSEKPQVGWVHTNIVENRLDVDYFNPDYVASNNILIDSGLTIMNLGKIAQLFTGPFGSKLPSNLYRSSGIPLLRVKNIGEFQIETNNLVFLDQETHEDLIDSRLLKADLALAKSGSFGNVVPIWPKYGECNITEHILGIRVANDEIDPVYLAVFLSSRFGMNQVKQKANGTLIKYLGVETSRSIKVSIPASEIQVYIGDKVRLAERCREEAKISVDSARMLLVKALCFDLYGANAIAIAASERLYKVINNTPACVKVSPSLLGNGITAERYLPGDLAKDEILKSHQVELAYLGEIAKDFVNGYDCRDYKPEGAPYLKVANIRPNELVLDGVQFVPLTVMSLSKKFQLRQGDLLITRKGSFGICTTVLPKMEKMVFSSEVIRIPLKDGWDSDYVALYLNSPFGKYQFDRLATGTTMKGINHENLADVGVPKIDLHVQREIGVYVRRFMQLTEQAKDLISEAKSDAEKLIEGKLDTEGIISERIKVPTWEDIQTKMKETL